MMPILKPVYYYTILHFILKLLTRKKRALADVLITRVDSKIVLQPFLFAKLLTQVQVHTMTEWREKNPAAFFLSNARPQEGIAANCHDDFNYLYCLCNKW